MHLNTEEKVETGLTLLHLLELDFKKSRDVSVRSVIIKAGLTELQTLPRLQLIETISLGGPLKLF